MCVCVYYVYTYTYTYIYIYTFIYFFLFIYVFISLCIYICVCVYLCVCMFVLQDHTAGLPVAAAAALLPPSLVSGLPARPAQSVPATPRSTLVQPRTLQSLHVRLVPPCCRHLCLLGVGLVGDFHMHSGYDGPGLYVCLGLCKLFAAGRHPTAFVSHVPGQPAWAQRKLHSAVSFSSCRSSGKTSIKEHYDSCISCFCEPAHVLGHQ